MEDTKIASEGPAWKYPTDRLDRPAGPAPLLERSETFAKVALALAKAQASFTEVEKNCTAKVPMKSGGSYSFDYADLAAIRAATSPALTANGLAILASVSTEVLDKERIRVSVQTELIHESGEWFRTPRLFLDVFAGDQKLIGGTSTYFRRYQAQNLLGIAAEDDKDADGAGERKETYRSAPPPPASISGVNPGRFQCRYGHKHTTAEGAKTCTGDGAPAGEAPADQTSPPAAPPAAPEDPVAVCQAALEKKDWRAYLGAIGKVPPQKRDEMQRQYQSTRYPKEQHQ